LSNFTEHFSFGIFNHHVNSHWRETKLNKLLYHGFFEDYVAKEFVHSWDPKILAKRLDDVKCQYLSLSPGKKEKSSYSFCVG